METIKTYQSPTSLGELNLSSKNPDRVPPSFIPDERLRQVPLTVDAGMTNGLPNPALPAEKKLLFSPDDIGDMVTRFATKGINTLQEAIYTNRIILTNTDMQLHYTNTQLPSKQGMSKEEYREKYAILLEKKRQLINTRRNRSSLQCALRAKIKEELKANGKYHRPPARNRIKILPTYTKEEKFSKHNNKRGIIFVKEK